MNMKKHFYPPQTSVLELHEAGPVATSGEFIQSLIEEDEFNGWTTN